MTVMQMVITIAMCALGTIITRFTPFIIFNGKKPTPAYIRYLGKALPPAIFAMLVVYCLKSVKFTSRAGHYGLPEMIAMAATIGVHLWKRSMMLSMLVGTVLYMILVQVVFI